MVTGVDAPRDVHVSLRIGFNSTASANAHFAGADSRGTVNSSSLCAHD